MIADDPAVYFTTPHFDGYPAILVRLAEISVPELTELGHPANGDLFGELIHPNHLRHRLLAARLLRLLARHALLADLREPTTVDPGLPLAAADTMSRDPS